MPSVWFCALTLSHLTGGAHSPPLTDVLPAPGYCGLCFHGHKFPFLTVSLGASCLVRWLLSDCQRETRLFCFLELELTHTVGKCSSMEIEPHLLKLSFRDKVAQAGFKLTILLPQPLECCGNPCAPQCLIGINLLFCFCDFESWSHVSQEASVAEGNLKVPILGADLNIAVCCHTNCVVLGIGAKAPCMLGEHPTE